VLVLLDREGLEPTLPEVAAAAAAKSGQGESAMSRIYPFIFLPVLLDRCLLSAILILAAVSFSEDVANRVDATKHIPPLALKLSYSGLATWAASVPWIVLLLPVLRRKRKKPERIDSGSK
jgi:hypothetical protein